MHSSVWGRVRALVALIVVFVAIVPSAATVAQPVPAGGRAVPAPMAWQA